MATFLFDKIIFGPVRSRRLGISLGINLLPTDSKLSHFNCIYCECGWTPAHLAKNNFHSREEIYTKLEAQLQQMREAKKGLDVITYAGNGEPTMHPNFNQIIDDTIRLRNQYFPQAKIAVLSNASMLHKPQVVQALQKIEQNILKLDSAIETTIKLINNPLAKINLIKLTQQLLDFEGNLIIQTLFLRGKYKGEIVDNTTEEELTAWVNLIEKVKPKQVMIYTIARDTPTAGLEKIARDELNSIASLIQNLGISTQVSS